MVRVSRNDHDAPNNLMHVILTTCLVSPSQPGTESNFFSFFSFAVCEVGLNLILQIPGA